MNGQSDPRQVGQVLNRAARRRSEALARKEKPPQGVVLGPGGEPVMGRIEFKEEDIERLHRAHADIIASDAAIGRIVRRLFMQVGHTVGLEEALNDIGQLLRPSTACRAIPVGRSCSISTRPPSSFGRSWPRGRLVRNPSPRRLPQTTNPRLSPRPSPCRLPSPLPPLRRSVLASGSAWRTSAS